MEDQHKETSIPFLVRALIIVYLVVHIIGFSIQGINLL